jgi:mono/diheme cytochrome c family protein
VTNRRVVLCFLFLLVACMASTLTPQAGQSARASRHDDTTQLPVGYVPSGKQMYREYCASCHGADGRGRGPVAVVLRKQPPNLTTLAQRHGGTFPEDYVISVLRFGPGFSGHGSSEMPVWGPIFQYLENYNEAAVRQRIKNLCDFLKSIQEK